MNRASTGLVLTAGGARAAYQAGVVEGIAEILRGRDPAFPFPILSGVSAGAINCLLLASAAHSFDSAASGLRALWSNLRSEQVIRTDVAKLSWLGARWLRDLSVGGLFGSHHSTYLLDPSPLKQFLKEKIRFDTVSSHLGQGLLRGVAVTATSYKTGTAITFFDGASDILPWARTSRLGLREKLTLEHVLASASIPILFPPVQMRDGYYGDGSIRLSSPLSPAIHLGAQRIVVIGIRYCRTDDETIERNVVAQEVDQRPISLAEIVGVMLNAAFFDSLDSDIERLQRINQTLEMMDATQLALHPSQLRPIPILAIRPSEDLGAMACEQFHRFPRMLRYLLSGIGASSEQGWDLLSYLAFDEVYTKKLLDLGFRDALARRGEIEAFLLE